MFRIYSLLSTPPLNTLLSFKMIANSCPTYKGVRMSNQTSGFDEFKNHIDSLLSVLDAHKFASEIIVAFVVVFILISAFLIFREPISEGIARLINKYISDNIEKEKLQEINDIIPTIEEQIDYAIETIESLRLSLITKEDIEQHYQSIQNKLEEVKKTVSNHYENLNTQLSLQNQQLHNKLQQVLNQIESSLLAIKGEINTIKVMTEQIKEGQKDTKDKLKDLSNKFDAIHKELSKIEDICESKENGSRF